MKSTVGIVPEHDRSIGARSPRGTSGGVRASMPFRLPPRWRERVDIECRSAIGSGATIKSTK
eukprot:4592348-Prymnesium_polylepis.1